ncbi:MAG: hypothetical protein QOH70_2329 [Blastocatellia bacterium]|jgi:predicted nucleic acid-binding protein|nr:hypothetical protein [Blastocatellia bacterium]
MKLLIDTNIFLEVLLEQRRAADARELLAKANQHICLISDFSLHSIGVILLRRNKANAFRSFLSDMITNGGSAVALLEADEMRVVIDHATNSISISTMPISMQWQISTTSRLSVSTRTSIGRPGAAVSPL